MWFNVILTSGGNLLTVIAFLRDRNIYSKPANLLILNLAFADLKVGLVSLPLFNLWWHYGDWIFGEYVCKWWVIVDYTATLESMIAILLISWDRLWMVRNIQSYVQNQTRQKVVVIILISWILTYSYYIVTVLLLEPITGKRNIDYTSDCDFPPNYYLSFTIFEVMTQFTIPVLALSYFNLGVFYVIRKRAKVGQVNETSAVGLSATADTLQAVPITPASGNDRLTDIPTNDDDMNARSQRDEDSTSVPKVPKHSLRKDRKAAITLTLLVVTYILCWAPYNVVIILETLSEDIVSKPVASFTEYLLWMNSGINPFLYVATNTQFRNQLKTMFSYGR
ncbi:histamine H4 receptor-like [Amphiura filiformis]|uniref:histamine H4 receptor-like n=1 Tax=Amphiura filiformis TaxID=82378 RepID=UPI003B225C01